MWGSMPDVTNTVSSWITHTYSGEDKEESVSKLIHFMEKSSQSSDNESFIYYLWMNSLCPRSVISKSSTYRSTMSLLFIGVPLAGSLNPISHNRLPYSSSYRCVLLGIPLSSFIFTAFWLTTLALNQSWSRQQHRRTSWDQWPCVLYRHLWLARY